MKVRVYHTCDHSCPVLCTESVGKKACVIEEFLSKSPSEKTKKSSKYNNGCHKRREIME